ncbi:hypothetical protein CEP52_006846 [Fusarium oligoseptatum]|uniref:Uncharacterized protein n=1 Tax=Fusarium oligoseptatum TaxID=2604345 RepID=A0A428TR27_9HYPO|nr:hypothetical protein CEP52_006846 [Fusarium oligoseptatum]
MQSLLQRSIGIGELITEGLQFRAGASMLRISKTNVESLSNLIKIAKQGEMEEVLVRKTSINTASLAFVATVYLPATLLSAIFSSDLVVSDGGHFYDCARVLEICRHPDPHDFHHFWDYEVLTELLGQVTSEACSI